MYLLKIYWLSYDSNFQNDSLHDHYFEFLNLLILLHPYTWYLPGVMLSCWLILCLPICYMYVRPSVSPYAFCFCSITGVIFNRFLSYFAVPLYQECLTWDCEWANFDNFWQNYGTWHCRKLKFWPLVPLLFGISCEISLLW